MHNAAPELYGHLTATDIFGSAYVIPALNTFDNIRDCLGAVSVTLPAVADLNQGRSSESNEVEDSALPEDTRDSSRFGINRIWSSAAPCTEDQTPSTPNSQANNQRYPSKQDHMPPAPSREPFQKFSSITAKRWSAQLSRNECPEWAFDSWFEHLDFSYTNNPLELFMESYQNPLELHTSAVIKFCADAQHTDLVDCYEFGRVWLDDRHDACLENVEAHGPCEIHEKPSRNYPGLLTAHQLREHLKIPVGRFK